MGLQRKKLPCVFFTVEYLTTVQGESVDLPNLKVVIAVAVSYQYVAEMGPVR